MDSKTTRMIGQWAFFIGMVLAIVTAFVSLGGWVTQVLIILGILAGIFHKKIQNELVTVGVIYVALTFAANSMQELIAVGPYISAIANAWVSFLGPVVLMALMMWGGAYLMVNTKLSKKRK